MGGTEAGNHQGGANSVSQVDGVSDKVSSALCGSVRGGLRRGAMASASSSVWEKAVPLLSP